VDPTTPTEAARPSGSTLYDLTVALEQDRRLDGAVDALDGLVGARLGRGRPRELLGGRWLGHALHPLLTDVPIGLWVSATALDWFGGRRSAPAAQRLVGLGVVAAVPTAVTGLSDWTATNRDARRVGVVHAAANGVALLAYSGSWLARRRGHRLRGRVLALVGGVTAAVGGHLGGHLAIARGVGVDATADVLDTTVTGPAAPAAPAA
jgi:uncharacterized membrane protein